MLGQRMALVTNLEDGSGRLAGVRSRVPLGAARRPALLGFAAAAVASAALVIGPATGTAAAARASERSTPRAARAQRVVDRRVIPKYGAVLVTVKGMTLYHYTADKKGKVACTGSCAQLWRPLVLEPRMRQPLGGTGVSGLGVVKDPDGKLQVTYHGEPLYTYVGDHRPGTANGEGLFHKWFAVQVGKKSTTAAGTTSKSAGGSSW